MPLPVFVKLSSIYCNDEADGIGNAEPYLWTIFFRMDGQTIQQNGAALTGHASFAFGPGSHENLRTHAVEDGESVRIPAELGEWNTTLSPIIIKDLKNNTYRIPGIAGVIAVLMEEDNVSDSGAEAGHQALNKFIMDSINNFITGISLLEFVGVDNPQEKLNELIAALVKKIKDESKGIVKNAIRNQQPWYNDAWAFINADDNIGSEVWMFDQDEIVQNHYAMSLYQRFANEGNWEIFGHVSAPNPCQSQLTVVLQQQHRIQGVEEAIRRLQQEFREAPAAEKPIIQQEIDELKAQLSPLEAELQRFRSLLNRCYTRQRIISDINDSGIVIGRSDGRFQPSVNR